MIQNLFAVGTDTGNIIVRIWHRSTTELDELGAYKASLVGHAMKVLDPGQRVEVRGMPGGRLSRKVADGSAVERVRAPSILDPVLDSAVRAEREGFDAFVVGSFSEPFLRELRSAIDRAPARRTPAGRHVCLTSGLPACGIRATGEVRLIHVSITDVARHLIDSFEALPAKAQHEVHAQLLRR